MVLRFRDKMIKFDRIFFKKAIAIVLVIAAIFTGVALWITAHYKHVIRKKLPEWVIAATDSVYTISYQNVSINIFTHSITITGLQLRYDTAQIKKLHEHKEANKNYVALNIPEVEFENISWTKSIGKKELTCDGIYVYHPKIQIIHMPWLSDTLRNKNKKEPKIKRLFTEQIKIKYPEITYRDLEPNDNSVFRSDGGIIILKNWEFKPLDATNTNSFLLAENGTVSLSNISYEKPKRLYNITANSLYFSSSDDSMRIAELRITPSIDTVMFYTKIGHQADMLHFFFPSITCSGFDWQKFTMQSALVTKSLLIDNAVINDYFSRLPPRDTETKYGKFPHQLLQKLELPIYVQNATLTHSAIKYTELNNITKIPATLSFDDISGNFNNVTNIPDSLTVNKNCFINLHGKFMGQFDMVASINLLLTDKAGTFTANSYMTGLQAPAITKQSQALAMVNIKTLYGSRFEFAMKGNEDFASATMTVQYENLKIKLQKLSKDSTRLKNKTITSFFANYSLLFPANPMPGENIRVVNTYTKRLPDQSFFNLIWKNLLQGIFKTIARNEETAKLMEQQANSGTKKPVAKKKKGLLKLLFSRKNKDRP